MTSLRRTVLPALIIFAASNIAVSCPVCYGQTDSNAASAVNASVLALLIITGAVLSMFGSFILVLRKRLKLAQATSSTNSTQIERK